MSSHPLLKRLTKNRSGLRRVGGGRYYASVLRSNELLYERMFSNALPRFRVENRFYPVKSAATYSLLYLILRVVTELPVKSIVELGAGQTTLLLDALKLEFGLDVVTLEHSHEWAAKIGGQVESEIQTLPLVEKTVFEHRSEVYDFSCTDLPNKIDLLIVDGPAGRRHRSRWGCLEFIKQLLSDDFIIIFDDAQRKGEIETIEGALRLLDARGQVYSVGITESVSSQCLIAGGTLVEASYF